MAPPSAGVVYDSKAELLRFAEVTDESRMKAARLTLRAGTPDAAATAAMNEIRSELSEQSLKMLRDYTPELPKQHVAKITQFVEDAVALTLPTTTYAAKTLLLPCMRFVYWAVFVVGCEQDSAIIFDRDLIEHYIRDALPKGVGGKTLVDGTLRNYRAWLLRVAEAVNPEKNPRRVLPLNQRGMDAPYDADELAVLADWAAGQKSPYMRQGAKTLLALGAGAGLKSVEIVQIRREDVAIEDDGAVVITIQDSERAREVVMSGAFEKKFTKLLRDVPAGAFVFLPKRTRTENDVVSAFVGRTTTLPDSMTVSARRLRNTWIVRHLTNRVDAFTLMEAAGLQSLESISRLAVFVTRPAASSRRAQMRGTE